MPLDGSPTSAPLLPEPWTVSERVDDVVEVDGLTIRRAGLCASSEHAQAVGSAASIDEDPAPRATFELLERIAVDEASRAHATIFRLRSRTGEDIGGARAREVFPPSDHECWAFARSNGVSLHTEWTLACDGAARELIERDRILRAWLGETLPVRIPGGFASRVVSGTPSYDWRTYLFPAPTGGAFGRDLDVVGVFGFPRAPTAPLVFGFGARPDRDEATRAAVRESLQLLAFLWGEPIPERVPKPAPTTMAHLETYQVRDRHPILLRWLERGHHAHHRPRPAADADSMFRFADLTPPALAGHVHVAKALCAAAIPLTLGLSPLLAHLPPELRVHPIP